VAADTPAERPSKSQRKRDATALQRLGERLVALRPDQLAPLPLGDELREAVLLAQRITARGGRRRQLQLVGKLMRAADAQAISRALEALGAARQEDTARLHRLEGWRARLLRDGPPALDALLLEHPSADRALLERLIASARHGSSGARTLFRYLRELMPTADEGPGGLPPPGRAAG
jgi:ribosome-associated protein